MHSVNNMISKGRIYIILFTLCCVFSGCMTGKLIRFSPDYKFPRSAVMQDLSVMESTLRRYHPSLYWYADSLNIAEAFRRGRSAIKDSMNEPSIRNLFNEVASSIHCGHTSVRHSKTYSRYLTWKPVSGFPLSVKITDDSTLVLVSNFNRSDSVLTRGVQILSINQLSARSIIDTLSLLVPMDGYSKNFSHQVVSNNFSRFYNSKFMTDSTYRIVFRDSVGNFDTALRTYYNRFKDSSLWRTSFRKAKKIVPPERLVKKEMLRSFFIDTAAKTAFLRLNTFSNDIKRRYIKNKFKKIKQEDIPYLILDLRNNGGGLIGHSLLLAQLIHQHPFRYIDSVVTHVGRIKKQGKQGGYITKRIWINLAMKVLHKKQKDGLNGFKFFAGKTYKPHRLQYKGKIFILTGGATFSATSMLLASLKGLPNVTIIGEETGGAYYGNNGVFIPDIVLPNSRLRVRLPLYRIINNHSFPNNGRGVLPDIEVRANAESIRRNKDVKMEKAEALIKEDLRSSLKSATP